MALYHIRNLEVGEILWFTLRYITCDATLAESMVDPPSTAGKRTSNFSIVADHNCTWNVLEWKLLTLTGFAPFFSSFWECLSVPPHLPWTNLQRGKFCVRFDRGLEVLMVGAFCGGFRNETCATVFSFMYKAKIAIKNWMRWIPTVVPAAFLLRPCFFGMWC